MDYIQPTTTTNNTFHIVEDDLLLREALSEIIQGEGYHVMSFESGEAYLQHLHSSEFKHPISVLTDVKMPGIQGYDLALAIHRKRPFQHIFLMTGYANSEEVAQVANRLCYILAKPFDFEELMQVITALDDCYHDVETAPNAYPKTCKFGLGTACPLHTSKQLPHTQAPSLKNKLL